MNFINLIGLEVEGGWGGTPGVAPFDIPIIQDHSIDGRTHPADKRMESPHVGEVVSVPLEPTQENIKAWIDKYWPTETNVTCGYHIHLSFKKIKYYSLLTRKSFLFDLLRAMRELGHKLDLPETHYLWARLNGANPFATINFDASRQMDIVEKNIGDRTRYGFLNCCWGVHKTLEFRALPTFENPKLALLFTLEYLAQVEKYLEAFQSFSYSASATLIDAGTDVIELVK